jgi:DNA-binding CsgD family transcriptional regulator
MHEVVQPELVYGDSTAAPSSELDVHSAEPLSETERQVLGLVSQGAMLNDIAESLSIPYEAAKTVLSDIYTKTGAVNRPHAVRLGIEWGDIDLNTKDVGEAPVLTALESLTLELGSFGLLVRETAQYRGVSPETVKTTNQNLIVKLQARNLAHAVLRAFETGEFHRPTSTEDASLSDTDSADPEGQGSEDRLAQVRAWQNGLSLTAAEVKYVDTPPDRKRRYLTIAYPDSADVIKELSEEEAEAAFDEIENMVLDHPRYFCKTSANKPNLAVYLRRLKGWASGKTNEELAKDEGVSKPVIINGRSTFADMLAMHITLGALLGREALPALPPLRASTKTTDGDLGGKQYTFKSNDPPPPMVVDRTYTEVDSNGREWIVKKLVGFTERVPSPTGGSVSSDLIDRLSPSERVFED